MRRLAALTLAISWAVPAMARQSPDIDATRLGVDLARIQRELRIAGEREERRGDDPLKLDIQIQVYGLAPKIDLFAEFPLEYGPLRWGVPTHQQVLEVLTPRGFSQSSFPVAGFAFWAAKRLWDYQKQADCRRQVEEYRRQVMAGLDVAPPRCAR